MQAMSLKNSLLLVLSVGFISSATPFHPAEDSASNVSTTPNIVEPAFPSNVSPSLLNSTADNAFNIRCDGETYGYNPNIVDCEGAKEYLSPDTRMWTFGERHTGLPDNTLPLPYRIMGDRGLCYVQTVLIGDHKTGTASLNMLRRVAAGLILQCATSVVSQGGIATNIGECEFRLTRNGLFQGPLLMCIVWLARLGGDNNLAVILGTYQIPVACRGTLRSWESCRDILYDIPADKIPRVFGPRGDPGVVENLPYNIGSGTSIAPFDFQLTFSKSSFHETEDVRCFANLFSTGKSDVASYYEIWEAVIALFSVCVRHGKTGSIRGIGMFQARQESDLMLCILTSRPR